MILKHNCFPADWIGKKLVKKMNDRTYCVDGIDSNQIIVSDGYGKPIAATWLPNGAIRFDMDTNGNKLFYVGTQRFFLAYGDETEPHDKSAYEKAVKECQRLREEDNAKGRNQNDSNNSQSANKETKSTNTGFGALIGGAGAVINSTREAINDFRSIDDSSEYEAFATQFGNDMLNQMAEREQNYEKQYKQMLRNEKRRDKELEKLTKYKEKFDARVLKERIFSELYAAFTKYEDDIPEELICKILNIFYDNKRKEAVSCALEGYILSLSIVGATMQLYMNWSEIFYLIEEGFAFREEHIMEITKMINQSCNPTNEEDFTSFNNYLEQLYSKAKYAYWGCDFEKDPKEDEIRERIKYLETTPLDEIDFKSQVILDEDINNRKKTSKTKNIEEKSNDSVDSANGHEKRNESGVNNQKQEHPSSTEEKILTKCKYPDLESTNFEKDNSSDEFKTPVNAFDIITKGKNKLISKKKDKWNEVMFNFDHQVKKNLLNDLLRIDKNVANLSELETRAKTLSESGHTTGFFGIGGSKELKETKSSIKRLNEQIKDNLRKLSRSYRDFNDCEKEIEELQKDMFDMTGLEKYADFKPTEGKGISIIRLLINNKSSDMATLINIFDFSD